jgi:hypothetical protein
MSIKEYNIVDVVCASEHEEFFYKHNNEEVREYEPVGVEVEYSDRIDLVLFDNIYWSSERL